MKTKFIGILVLILFPAFVFAQLNERSATGLSGEEHSLFSTRPNFGMEVGTSFTTGFGGNSFFNQSIAPHMQFSPARNFSLQVGTIFSTTGFGSAMPVMQSDMMPSRMYSNTVYAFGAYQLNPRLTLTGGAWTESNNLPVMENQMNPGAFDMNARGVVMGMDYRITENLRFGAEVNISRGHNPFSPYSSGFGSPYGSPFNRRGAW